MGPPYFVTGTQVAPGILAITSAAATGPSSTVTKRRRKYSATERTPGYVVEPGNGAPPGSRSFKDAVKETAATNELELSVTHYVTGVPRLTKKANGLPLLT